MKWLLALALAAPLAGAGSSRVFYSKSFPGSVPAYVAIVIDKEGRGEYREAPDDNPVTFQLTPAETAEIFSLTGKLDRFTRPLESHLKVASTGVKTFRYESGAEKNEVQFNYSLDANARELWDWFERISETEQHFIQIERAVRFEKIGVNDALLQLEISRDHKRLVAARQFLPLLERIAKDESYLHMARERAASLADSFRANGGGPRQ